MKISEKRRSGIYERDGFRCQYCGEKVTDKTATLDHVIPKGKGGGNNSANLKTSCRKCNSSKGSKDINEYRAYVGLMKTEYGNVISISQYAQLSSLGVKLNPIPVVRFLFEDN